MEQYECESNAEIPKHIAHFLLQQKKEEATRILEREALNDLFRDLEPGQYFGPYPHNSLI